MRPSLVAGLLFLGVSSIAANALAEDPEDDTATEESPPADDASHDTASLSLDATFSSTTPSLGSAHFTGTGTNVDGGGSHHFDLSGKQLGVLRPNFHLYGGTVDVGWGIFYGKLHFDMGKSGPDAPSIDSTDVLAIDRDTVTMWRFGPELGAHVWLDDHVRFEIGAVVGLEEFSMKAPDYRMKCKAGQCPLQITDTLPWLEPRLSMQVLLGEKIGLGLGGYVGTQLLDPRAVDVGITISFTGVGKI